MIFSMGMKGNLRSGHSPMGRVGVLLIVVVFVAVQQLGSCRCLNEEGLALLKVREGILSDPFGVLRNWVGSDGKVDHCSWFGVECRDGKVVVLKLGNLCLRGTLALEIGKLIHIRSIILRNNTFLGSIPEEIADLKELELLDLGFNNFSGPIPNRLVNDLSTATILLDNNEFLAPLSPEIHLLKMFTESQINKQHLCVSSNRLSCRTISLACTMDQTEDFIPRRVLAAASPGEAKDSRGGSSPYSRERPREIFLNPQTPSEAPPPPKSVSTSGQPISPRSVNPPPSPKVESSGGSPLKSKPTAVSKKNDSMWSHPGMVGGVIGGSAFVLITILGLFFCKGAKVATVKPWVTGLSGQLQKAFIIGVPKLKRAELEMACEDFSNVVGSSSIGMIYKGTLSNGTEIAVASVPVKSAKDWSKNLKSQFRKTVETLSKVNHKNFANLIGYCEEEEPFTRMMVFEYAPNGTLFEHLHIKESELLDWKMRLRAVMGIAYCLEHMHQLNPPIVHKNLNSSAINLTDDYAAKISYYNCWTQVGATQIENPGFCLLTASSASRGPETNVYAFGVILFEMLTGRLPFSIEDNSSVEDWASDYLRGGKQFKEMVDPSLESFDEQQVEGIGQVIRMCVNPDQRRRPPMREVTARLRAITNITRDSAIPKISPLWWAELEIISTDVSL